MEMGSSGSSGQQSAQQGFRDLPPNIQGAFDNLAVTANNMIGTQNDRYNPTALSQGENQAISAVNSGFAPTAASISSDIAMQQNPYDQYVIDEINRQSQGSNSILQQNTNAAGQFGSNRQMLGANDIDLSRLGQIGQFKQGQFNTNLNNAMTILPQARANDAQAQMGVGQFQRGLNMQAQQAPISSLKDISAILGVLPTNSGQSSGSNESSSFNFGAQW